MEQKRKRLIEEEAREGSEICFKACNQPLAMMPSFRYIGRTLTQVDNNLSVGVSNLQKESKAWDRLSQILMR